VKNFIPPGTNDLSFSTLFRLALMSTEPPIQWVAWAVSARLEKPGREADHSPPSSAEVKNRGAVFMALCLIH
jgi:hypothetical protein